MILNRSLKVSMVKDAPVGDAVATLTPDEINQIVKTQVDHIAVTVGVILLTKKAADTVSELILIAGRKYI
jgi:hypothetical protein